MAEAAPPPKEWRDWRQSLMMGRRWLELIVPVGVWRWKLRRAREL